MWKLPHPVVQKLLLLWRSSRRELKSELERFKMALPNPRTMNTSSQWLSSDFSEQVDGIVAQARRWRKAHKHPVAEEVILFHRHYAPLSNVAQKAAPAPDRRLLPLGGEAWPTYDAYVLALRRGAN